MANFVLVQMNETHSLIDLSEFRRIEVGAPNDDFSTGEVFIMGRRDAMTRQDGECLDGPYATWEDAQAGLLDLARRMGVTK